MKTVKEAAIENTSLFGFPKDTEFRGEIKQTYNCLIQSFENGVEWAQRWISVEEELPTPEDGVVLVRLMDGRTVISFMLVCGDFAYNVNPTHWRPIEFE